MFNDVSLKVLEKALGAASLRQNVIANNLANIDTPGFKRSEVQFEDFLARRMNQAGDVAGMNAAIDSLQPNIKVDSSTSLRIDGNNVDIDQEMTTLAKNELYYNALVREISSQLGILRMAISENV